MLGWIAKPLAATGFGLQTAAQFSTDPKRARKLAFEGQALSLDALTIEYHGDKLAGGMAALAPHVPWAARVLESAARISPFSEFLEGCLAVVFQGLVNHGVMPAMKALNTLTPEQLAAAAGVPMDYEE